MLDTEAYNLAQRQLQSTQMKIHIKIWSAALGLLLGAGQALAGNITIGDPNSLGETLSGWYKGGSGPASEYQEVEPGMQSGPSWDLVAFTATPGQGKLGVLSGYDLANGFSNTTLGDIFISEGVPSWMPEGTDYTQFTSNVFNFDYALRLDIPNNQYSVIALDANTMLENAYYYNDPNNYNAASNPWRVSNNHGPLNVIGTYALSYTNGLNSGLASGLAGFAVSSSYKYYVELQNMNWYTATEATLHLTMECGNDNLFGYTQGGFQRVPDGAATVALLGLGLLGLATVRRFAVRS